MIALTDKQLSSASQKVQLHCRALETYYKQTQKQMKELEVQCSLLQSEVTRLTRLCSLTPFQHEQHRSDVEAARFFMEQRLAGAIDTINKTKAR